MNVLGHLWHDILLVWTFFTRVPAPRFSTKRTLAQALWALPLVSLVLGGVQVALFWGLSQVFEIGEGGAVEALLGFFLVLLPLILTGALHWDGLADLADGMGVGKDRRLAVMRDPTIGAFGVLTLVAVFVLQVILMIGLLGLLEPHAVIQTLLIVALLSRQTMAYMWAISRAEDGQNKTAKGKPSLFVSLAPWAFFLGALIGLDLIAYPLVLVFIAVLALLLWGLRRLLPSLSGDALGATQVLSETLLLLLILVSHA